MDQPSWAPTVAQVAAHLLGRTREANGSLAGTFNSSTLPTDTQVQQIIAQQVSLYAPRLGDVPDDLADAATELLALKAATVVERSYFIEQVGTEMSPYKDMCADFKFAEQQFFEAAQGDVPNGYRTAALPVGSLYPGYATGTY